MGGFRWPAGRGRCHSEESGSEGNATRPNAGCGIDTRACLGAPQRQALRVRYSTAPSALAQAVKQRQALHERAAPVLEHPDGDGSANPPDEEDISSASSL